MSSAPVHSVHFYDHDEALIARLQNIVASSLEEGSSVLIVATEEHRNLLQAALVESGVALDKAPSMRFQLLDAEETLDRFIVNGHPDRRLFAESIGETLGAARSVSQNGGLTVFGEMVAVLWSKDNVSGALELERLWNDLLHDRTFHLHCAYPRSIFNGSAKNVAIKAICDEHSSVLGFANHLQRSALAH